MTSGAGAQPANRLGRCGVDVAWVLLYLRDPDDNGVELYWDRPPEHWPRTPGGELAMFTRRLDLNSLLKEIESGQPVAKVGEGPRDL